MTNPTRKSTVRLVGQLRQGTVITGDAVPLRDPLSTPMEVEGIDADTLGGVVEELVARFEEDTDGLVNGQDLLTYYKLSRDN